METIGITVRKRKQPSTNIGTWLGGGDEQGWWFRSRNVGPYNTSTFIGSYSGAPESWAMSDMGFANPYASFPIIS